ncbi:MAG: DUF4399 domain-containing protein [Porticoccaceae bacterium]|nr:DUF4399 domain-containing protein [Porticoccaceae bacterium]MDG1474467.1 DUF4399 domain-containing protein [Porticoccaceae bacterium]
MNKSLLYEVKRLIFGMGLIASAFSIAEMPNSSAPADASVYFVQPLNGQIFKSQGPLSIDVVFGLSGMQVSPAGMAVANSGHHHLLINVENLPDLDKPLPATDSIRHFGKGQTSTKVTLPVGKHRLQLVLGNHVHIPHSPPVMSEVIEIVVQD